MYDTLCDQKAHDGVGIEVYLAFAYAVSCVRWEPTPVADWEPTPVAESCSRVGERLGYGGGFYDRYLAKRNYPAVLLCRKALLLDEIPQGPHDLIMDAVLTESTTYRYTAYTLEYDEGERGVSCWYS
jgi:hypothetical protein